jgi:hypothetical protein
MPRKVPDGAPDSSLLLASLRCSEGAPIAEKAGHAALALPLWLSDGHNGTGDIAARLAKVQQSQAIRGRDD